MPVYAGGAQVVSIQETSDPDGPENPVVSVVKLGGSGSCCTDGVLVGPLRDGECVTVTLDGARGVSAPVVLDGSDRPIERAYGEPMEICAQIRPAV